MTDTTQRSASAELLLRVSNRLAAMPTLEQQLGALIELTVHATGAERGTLFLNDPHTGELYSRVALGHGTREIRIPNASGIAGHVFQSGEGLIIRDVYEDDRFNREIDEVSGFKTRGVLSAPIRTVRGEVIGVAQCLNKKEGEFTDADLERCEAMTMQAAVVLQSTLFVLRTEKLRQQEAEFLQVVSDVSSEIQLVPLLQKIMTAVTKMLDAERSTLFLYDEKTDELYTEIGQGLGTTSIRLPKDRGIAGTVFMTGHSVNIPHAYADLRFNPAFDKQTGFFTRSILCVPVLNKDGRCIGVTQVLNKRGGVFTDDDEARLRAFTAQISIGIENAKLFHDVQEMKNYTESMFESMSNGVVTFDEHGKLVRANTAALGILNTTLAAVEGHQAEELLSGPNAWVMERLARVDETREVDITMDAELSFNGDKSSVNLTALPLTGGDGSPMGSMLLIEDISTEKRVKSTMARYMDPSLADQLLASGEEILGGQSHEATVLFTDIRGFTPLTEELGPQATVSLLNEYFTVMVDCISREGGMLDKFIGDAIMAVFGLPIAKDDDQDRAVRTGIAMLSELNDYNQRRIENGNRPIKMGVGINTDIVVSGNIGSPRRMDYTVIGDGVNLAARLEGACKQYGAEMIISDLTFGRLRGTYRSREIDRVIVKGKTEPVAIHEILDYHTADSFPHITEVLGHFRDGVAHFRRLELDRALDHFREALRAHPGDGCSRMYVERCEFLRDHPPGDDWDGVWRLTAK